MYIVKSNGRVETVKFDKITARIFKMCYGLDNCISAELIAKNVIYELYDGISTTELDFLSAKIAAYHAIYHPDYALIASRLLTTYIHQHININFSTFIKSLHNQSKLYINNKEIHISEKLYEIVEMHRDSLNSAIINDLDFRYDYDQLHYFLDHFLIHTKHHVIESPQFLFMRIAIGIHQYDLEKILATYNELSTGKLSCSDTTLSQYGLQDAPVIPEFITSIKKGRLSDIYHAIDLTNKTRSVSSSLSVSLHNTTTEITSLVELFNSSVNYINKNFNASNSITLYIEPWHIGIDSILTYISQKQNLYKNFSIALWITDLFFQRLKENGYWTLFSPSNCANLSNVHNDEFVHLYSLYESEGKGVKTIKILELWHNIIHTQLQMGMPSVFYKDRANYAFNQQHIHTIQLSNGSGSWMLGASADETISCATTAVVLSKFVNFKQEFQYQLLFDTVYLATINLNKIVDINHYPNDSVMRFNLRHRPIGIDVEALNDTYILMGYPFESMEAQSLNRSIFETIYFAALSASNDLAKLDGAYSSFSDSLLSKGFFQFDLWNNKGNNNHLWNWDTLKEQIIKYGVRNSVLISLNAGCMPRLSNIKLINNSKENYIIDKILARHLIKKKKWTREIIKQIINNNGSVQNISELDIYTKALFKTAYEMDQYKVIDQHVARGSYICQSQTFSIFLSHPDAQLLSDLHLYAWEQGLKTGMCRLHIKE